MEFIEKYVSVSEKDKPENKDKKIISDDAFALGELLSELNKRLEWLGNKK